MTRQQVKLYIDEPWELSGVAGDPPLSGIISQEQNSDLFILTLDKAITWRNFNEKDFFVKSRYENIDISTNLGKEDIHCNAWGQREKDLKIIVTILGDEVALR